MLTPVILHLASRAILSRKLIPPIPWPMTALNKGEEMNYIIDLSQSQPSISNSSIGEQI